MAKKTASAAKARNQASGGLKKADQKGKTAKAASSPKKAASSAMSLEKDRKKVAGKVGGSGAKDGAAKPAPDKGKAEKSKAGKPDAAKPKASKAKESTRPREAKASKSADKPAKTAKVEKPAKPGKSAKPTAPAMPGKDKTSHASSSPLKPGKAASKPSKPADKSSKPEKPAAKSSQKTVKAKAPAPSKEKPGKEKPGKETPSRSAAGEEKAAKTPIKAEAKSSAKHSKVPSMKAAKPVDSKPQKAKAASKGSSPASPKPSKPSKVASEPVAKAAAKAPKPAPEAAKSAPKPAKEPIKAAKPAPEPQKNSAKGARPEAPAARSPGKAPRSESAEAANQSARLGLHAATSSPRSSGQKAPPLETASQGGAEAEADDPKRATVRRRRPVVTRTAADLLLDRAQRTLRQDRFDEARELYEKCINDYPDEVRGYVFYAQFHAARGNQNEAMKEFNRALRKDPNHIEALAGKAEFLETYDPPRSLNDALKIYKTILELHEGSESPDSQRHATFAADRIRYCEARKLSYQSRKFVKQGQPAALKQACKYLKEAYELYPNDRRNAMNYGYALFQVEDFENACKVCEAALRIDPKYARARLILGTAQARIGLLARARESLRQCLESAPSGSDYDDAHSSLKAVEHDLASIRNQLYDTLAGGLDDMPGLDKLKSWMVALTGEPISEADLGRRKDASYELMAIGPRQRFLASPGPEGLRIEILLPPRS